MARKLPNPILKEDFDKILEAVKKDLEAEWKPRKSEYTPTGVKLRDFLIAICLGFGSGMRISEISGLKKKQKYRYTLKNGTKRDTVLISNIPALTKDRIENNFIRIKSGKGEKDGIVPLPSKLLLRAGIKRKEFEQALPLKTKYRTYENLIVRYGEKLLKKHITFHQLRHGFVSHALNTGMPIHQVQAFARHSRMDTTGLYAHANPKEALNKYEEVF